MKKLSLLFAAILLFSCNNDDAPETHEFRDSLISRYELQAIYTNVPIDLNNDGIPQTDLWMEADCFVFDHFDGYYAEFKYNARYDYKNFSVDVPSSSYSMSLESMSTCFEKKNLYNTVAINEQTKEITITDRYEEWEAQHGSVTHIMWENGLIHFIVNKELYTSQGWQQVNIHLIYNKWIPNND